MKKPILTLVLVMAIGLIAVSVQAVPVGPGYGQDPGTEPPRMGVGNANSGNHNMHTREHRERWAYGDDEDFVPPMAPQGPRGDAQTVVPEVLTLPAAVYDFSLVYGLLFLQ